MIGCNKLNKRQYESVPHNIRGNNGEYVIGKRNTKEKKEITTICSQSTLSEGH